jgi:hypothetical protein|tara:strand:+ start:729 stop:959 length:231 start_codon:yes stop_codon:yes gene_type:complete
MREEFIKASKMHFKANVEKHRVNAENLLRNSVGIGEHGDVMEELEKELDQMANYDDKLEMLNKYFEGETNKELLKD